jgi:hypothetical protein
LSLSPDNLLSGAVGALIVFTLTVVYGAVIRALQRGRELVGLARVVRPEMERNSDAIGILQHAGLDPNTYRSQHPTRDAWRDTRIRLSQLMKDEDFAELANFYDYLEMLDVTINHNPIMAQSWLESAVRHQLPAMKVVDGYCRARWRIFKGWIPGDIE